MKLEVWSMICKQCGEDMVPIFVNVHPPLLSRWACNACGNSVSPNEAIDDAKEQAALAEEGADKYRHALSQLAGCDGCEE